MAGSSTPLACAGSAADTGLMDLRSDVVSQLEDLLDIAVASVDGGLVIQLTVLLAAVLIAALAWR